MTKSMKITIGVVVILLGLYFLNQWGQKKYTTPKTQLFTTKKEDIYGIVIKKGEDSLKLTLVDTVWKIEAHDSLKMKKHMINNFFNKVLNIQRESVVSQNPEKWKKFSVDDSSGTFLTLLDYSGKPLEQCIFGRSKSDFSRNYVRLTDDPNVYQTNANIIYQLQTRPTYWGEKPKPPKEETDTTKVEKEKI